MLETAIEAASEALAATGSTGDGAGTNRQYPQQYPQQLEHETGRCSAKPGDEDLVGVVAGDTPKPFETQGKSDVLREPAAYCGTAGDGSRTHNNQLGRLEL